VSGFISVPTMRDIEDLRRRLTEVERRLGGVAVYVNAPDCSCGHPQNVHWYPGAPRSCQLCEECTCYDGQIETLGVGRSPDKLYPARYDDNGCLILPPELE